MVPAGESLLKEAQPRHDLAGRIDVERRVEAACKSFKRDAVAMQGSAGLRIRKRARGWD
jgi:hypothetical protein